MTCNYSIVRIKNTSLTLIICSLFWSLTCAGFGASIWIQSCPKLLWTVGHTIHYTSLTQISTRCIQCSAISMALPPHAASVHNNIVYVTTYTVAVAAPILQQFLIPLPMQAPGNHGWDVAIPHVHLYSLLSKQQTQ